VKGRLPKDPAERERFLARAEKYVESPEYKQALAESDRRAATGRKEPSRDIREVLKSLKEPKR
jgi:hypothetical protein